MRTLSVVASILVSGLAGGQTTSGLAESAAVSHPLCNQPISTVAVPTAPHGIFVLQFPNADTKPLTKYIMNQPTVCGADIFVVWRTVDSGNGQYNWPSVDALINPWIAAGKSVNLIVWGVSDTVPNDATPDYVLKSSGYQSVSCTDQGSRSYPFPVYYSLGYKNNYKTFIQALLTRYGSNPYIGYIRFGLAQGGEANPSCVPQLLQLGGYSQSQFDTVWQSYVAEMTLFQQTVLAPIQAQGPSIQLMAALNGFPNNGGTPDFEAQNAVSLGFGFGSQGLQLSDISNFNSGQPCGSDWCDNFVQFVGQVPLELQTLSASDPTNATGGTGSLPVLLPFAVGLRAQILELYISDLQIAYDPTSPHYSRYSLAYQLVLNSIAAVVGGH